MQKLVPKSGSGVVTMPKDKLRDDGVLEDGEIPDDQCVSVDHIGTRTFVVRIPDDGGQLPDLHECEAIRRVAAEMALEMGANSLERPAD